MKPELGIGNACQSELFLCTLLPLATLNHTNEAHPKFDQLQRPWMSELAMPLLPSHRLQIQQRAQLVQKTQIVKKSVKKDGSGKKQVSEA